MQDEPVPATAPSERTAQIARVVAAVAQRRAQGGGVADAEVIAAHPELMPELGSRLRTLRRVEAARRAATSHGSTTGGGHLAEYDVHQPTLAPDAIAGYEIVEEMHQGGQGIVYRAVQKGTHREVAIKVLREGPFSSAAARARFDREILVLGQLQHPHIVTIHDSGSVAGSFYFVMDCISGRTLEEYVRTAILSVADTLRLFVKICGAVHAAHLRGIIHRDLKSSNILIDADGEPHVLDFGLAKLTSDAPDWPPTGADGPVTLTGQFVGSLPWASPEQAEGSPLGIDVRTDVYSLGVMLYHALTGRFPYNVLGNLRDVLNNIVRAEPERPGAFRKGINEEVETIVLKCLRKDRNRRYQSAGELARDLGHYLAGEPIDAKRESSLYVLRKHMRRYRIPLAVIAAFVLLLVGSSVVAWTLYAQARERLRDSYLAQARAQRLVPKPGRRIGSLEALASAAAIRPGLDLRNEAIACLALTDVRTIRLEASPADLQLCQIDFDAGLERMFYWRSTGETIIRRVADGRSLLELPRIGKVGSLPVPRFSADGRYIARASRTACEVWDIDRAEQVAAFAVKAADYLVPIEFSPDGQEVAVGAQDGTIHIHDLRRRQTRILPALHAPVNRLHFAPRGGLLATCSLQSRDALVRDVRTGEVRLTLAHPDIVWDAGWDPDETLLASACADRCVYLWDAETGQVRTTLKGHTNVPTRVRFDRRGQLLFSAAWDGTTRLWDVQEGTHELTLQNNTHAFSTKADAIGFKSGDAGHSVGIAEVLYGDAFRPMRGHSANAESDGVEWVQVSRDGRLIATASPTGTRIWDALRAEQVAFLPTGDSQSALFLPDGSGLITVGTSGVWRWPLTLEAGVLHIGPPVTLIPMSAGWYWHGSLSADGNILVAVDHDRGRAVVLDLAGNRELRTVGPHEGMRYAAISPDGKWLATGPWHGANVRIWDLAAGTLLTELPIPRAVQVAFSPDGRWLVTSEQAHTIWEVGTWREQARLSRARYDMLPGPLAFSPDGRVMAAAGDGPRIELVDLVHGAIFACLEGPQPIPIRSLAFAPDGTGLCLPDFARGHVLHVWDLRTVRQGLAAVGLDWNLPAYPPAHSAETPPAFRAQVDLGDLAR